MTAANPISAALHSVRRDLEERSFARKVERRGRWFEPLHGDRYLQGLVDEIITQCEIDVFVETGTFVGDTSKSVATRHPELRVLSCEVNARWLKLARRFCEGVENIELFRGQSPQFLKRVYNLLERSNPLFWLDAHWRDYWPLVDETKIVATLPRFVAIIDDFEVPGRPAFHYDRYNGIKNCPLLHKDVLGAECLIPDYDPEPSPGSPVGYGVYFKNLPVSGLERPGRLRKLSAETRSLGVTGFFSR